MFKKSALDVFNKESNQNTIISLSKKLDTAIGNGFPVGCITEICGPPGSGKTQLCLQLCVNVQIPSILGGINGKAIFVDTNYGFTPNRLEEIATACSTHCENIYNKRYKIENSTDDNVEKSNTEFNFNLNTIMENVLYTPVNDHFQLMSIIGQLDEACKTHTNIRLIIIDSFSFLIRNAMDNLLERTSFQYELFTDLQKLAGKYECAILITNETTTQWMGLGQTDIVPALGASHSHRVTQQITLGYTVKNGKNNFFAKINKSLYRPEICVPFRITKKGIRDYKND